MTLIELQHSIIIQSDVKADLGNRPFIVDKVFSISPSSHFDSGLQQFVQVESLFS